jgi:hypothetical protein
MGGHGFYHHGHEDGQNQYDWFLKNYVPPKQWPDAINTTKNNNKQPDFKPYGIMWGSDIWNLYGTEGLVKRTPTVTRQQRRRARQQVDMDQFSNPCAHLAMEVSKCQRDFLQQNQGFFPFNTFHDQVACGGFVSKYNECLQDEDFKGMALYQRVQRIQQNMGIHYKPWSWW